MGIFSRLLDTTTNTANTATTGWAGAFSDANITEKFGAEYVSKLSWIAKVFGPISIVMYILMGLVGAAGAVYAIYLGVMLAKAEDQSKRDEARKHLITVLIAVACTVVLVLFFNLLLPEIVVKLISVK